MNSSELEEYLKILEITVGVLHNYIDYENIEEPV